MPVALGICLAILPHLIAVRETGTVHFAADYDDLLYQVWAGGAVRHGSLEISDGVKAEPGPPMHPRLLFIPAGWVAGRLGIDLGLLWRLAAGIGLGLGLYVALRPAARRGRAAGLLAAFLLAEAGFLFGQPLLREFEVLASPLSGDGAVLDGVPRLLPHFRVPTPSWPLAVLLVHVGAVLQARRGESRLAEAVAAFAFGLLFHVYFYFWTAAGAALTIAWVVDPGGRRLYFRVALIGGLIGLPAVIQGARVKASTSPDWLLRTDKFIRIGRTTELLVPRIMLLEVAIVTPWVFLKRRDLIYPWSLTIAGLACANHQLATGLQIENFHWIYAYGSAFSVLCAALVGTLGEERQGSRIVLASVVIAWSLVAFGLRAVETRSTETLRMAELAAIWKSAGFAPTPGSVVAGDPELLLYAASVSDLRPLAGRLVEYCSAADDTELEERTILNMYLQGWDLDRMTAAAAPSSGIFGQEPQAARDPEIARIKESRRRDLIKIVTHDPSVYLEKYRVAYLILPTGATIPEGIRRTFRRRTGESGHVWELWERATPFDPS